MWVDAPWHDELDGRWAHVWLLFTQALGCTLTGHRFEVYERDEWDDSTWRVCHRCHRKWDWRP